MCHHHHPAYTYTLVVRWAQFSSHSERALTLVPTRLGTFTHIIKLNYVCTGVPAILYFMEKLVLDFKSNFEIEQTYSHTPFALEAVVKSKLRTTKV